MRLKHAALALTLCAGAAALGFLWFAWQVRAPGPLAENKIIYIAPGNGGRKIATDLQNEGAIRDALIFRVAAKLQEGNGPLRAGEYDIPARASTGDVIAVLQKGKTYQRQVTLAEGLMSVEIMELVNVAPALEGVVEIVPPEGSLLPDTYAYSRGDTREALVARMQKAMRDTLASLWDARAENLPVATPEETVILASIVEKETGVAAERAKVAGVFVNRLRLGMPLQSDPTTIYALTKGKKKLDRALMRKDLALADPYNTYYAAGLPPGPIANPGRASLEAVLHPESHDYLYFVADGTGGHAFAKSNEEHLRNVAAWRKISKNQ